jgi:hypothetical protein
MLQRFGQRLGTVFLVMAALGAWQIARAQDDEAIRGKVTFKVGDEEVEVVTDYCILMNTDDDYADGYELVGDDINLQGYFDLNTDGNYDGDDKIEYDDDDNIIPKSLEKKPASVIGSDERPESIIKLPGLGECPILGGQLMATQYKNTGVEANGIWEGTIELDIRTPKGPMKIKGKFKSEVVPTW